LSQRRRKAKLSFTAVDLVLASALAPEVSIAVSVASIVSTEAALNRGGFGGFSSYRPVYRSYRPVYGGGFNSFGGGFGGGFGGRGCGY